jgi:predicted short-subunit dehydrogenase-like oxidoreductase (DUF2520 family)
MNTAAMVTSRLAVVGRGRMGHALSGALEAAGVACEGPLGHGPHTLRSPSALLCVPDAQIAAAAAQIAPGPIVGHCSGALGLEVVGEHEAFGLHPLMTVTGSSDDNPFSGAACAVAGSTPRALALALELAERLEMEAFELDDDDRPAYHAAASIASNFLVTLEAAAEQLAASAGVPRSALVPLVRASVENWAAQGPRRALTGPVSRGDDATVARQRAAVAERAPELVALFDELVSATRLLAAEAPVAA